jgi:phosphate/sulfate permease
LSPGRRRTQSGRTACALGRVANDPDFRINSPRPGEGTIDSVLLIAQTTQTAVPTPGWWYFGPIIVFAVGMLIWDTVEVGRNDAANLVNAVYGSRLMTRERAVRIAGVATIVGAMLSAGVLETARKGIFKPSMMTPEQAVAVYVSVYVVDTVLLYGFSAFGMPVSTTACLVFELMGASFAMALLNDYSGVVQWGKAGTVVFAIICSIFLSGMGSFLLQRMVRGAIGKQTTDLRAMRLHGSWIGGGMATGLVFFLILKGAKSAWGVKNLKGAIARFDDWLKGAIWVNGQEPLDGVPLGTAIIVTGMWILFGAFILLMLKVYRERAARQVFPALAILGMLAMAVAFGQNDLANCASPGLATLTLIRHWDQGTAGATAVPIAKWMLFGCGVLLFLGMRTRHAGRVTKAEVRMGSQTDFVRLYAPQWCIRIAARFTRRDGRDRSLAPRPTATPAGKRVHYDPLRASTIMCVSASIIALASSYKLPVSTTYVTFAAVVGSGIGDRIFQRGDAALKLARAIWVVFSWFMAAAIAALFAGLVCSVVHAFSIAGLAVTVAINLYLRRLLKRRADLQEQRVRREADERAHAEEYALEEED